ncbi:unnamed protein product [Pleuronectes platessa]|uniref:Uncharacterized protein n=1 Tax=Pleuronectes platessa TaxID=8262 RepID=A0A9N7W485_PLEPL|nr:unnamed protein product [Pleuronectes platessa]
MLGCGRSILLVIFSRKQPHQVEVTGHVSIHSSRHTQPLTPTFFTTNNNNNTTTAVRSQPIRVTVPYQLLRGNQLSPTRSTSSSSSSSSSVAGSNTGPTTSPCSSPANPSGSGSDGRLVHRQRLSPPDSSGSPERPHDPPLS